ncbi:SIMPL domain-containing protein [bacterium]|nr:SIMPL domain-containing protein [bacterium]
MNAKSASIVALGLIAAALTFGLLFKSAQSGPRTVRVVGSADKMFDTDILKWSLELGRQSSGAKVTAEYAALRTDLAEVSRRLEGIGVPSTDIVVSPPVSYPTFRNDGQVVGYQISQTLNVISHQVEAVEKLALSPEEALSEGTVLRSSRLEYFYSGEEQLKHELLSVAAQDARSRAEAIASSSGLHAGAIREARAGVFQITEPYSTEVQDYGVHNTSSKKKQVRVTVHAEFELE